MSDQPAKIDPVEEASRDSFPASDAPAWTPVWELSLTNQEFASHPPSVLNPPKTRRLQTYTSRAMQVSADFVKRAFLLDFQRFGDGKLRLCS